MKSLKKLNTKEIQKKMVTLSDWTINTKETELSKTFLFQNFLSGLAFVAKVTVHAEIQNHHPDIELSYGKVKVKLSTHDVKGLSQSDFNLAKRIDGIKVA